MTEDEMAGWHHRLEAHEFEQALGVGHGQGSLAAVHGLAKKWTRLSMRRSIPWQNQYNIAISL